MLYIVGFWHLFNYTKAYPGYFNPVTTRLTVVVLGLFTLVSGYLMGKKDMNLTGSSLQSYYRSRFLRIYPPFLAALSIFFAMGAFKTGTLIKSALLLAMFWGPTPPTLWFITMIVCFYAIAPWMIHERGQSAWRYLVLGLIIQLILLANVTLGSQPDVRIWMYFPCFAAGLYMGKHPVSRAGIGTTLAVLTFVGSIFLSVFARDTVEQSLWSMPMALFGAVTVFLLLTGPWLRITRLPAVVTYLSTASYFMYLTHRPVLVVLHRIYQPTSGPAQVAYLMLVGIPFIVWAAWHLQNQYDRHIDLVARFFLLTPSKKI